MDPWEELFGAGAGAGPGAGPTLPARGRRGGASAVPAVVPTRTLDAGDLEALMDVPAGATVAPRQRMRHSHHELARLLAEGRPAVEVSAITGKTQAWISTLQQDPAFKELVEFYRAQKDAVYLDVHARLASLGMDAVAELQHRLDTAPEKLAAREVMEIAELALDRSVAPPKAGAGQGQGNAGQGTGLSLNISFVTPQAREGDEPPTIEGVAREVGQG